MAVMAATEPAEGARERLAAFVGEVVAGMAHVRQRANALVYVRGLIEHGGRKSLQPTLMRQGESAALSHPGNLGGSPTRQTRLEEGSPSDGTASEQVPARAA